MWNPKPLRFWDPEEECAYHRIQLLLKRGARYVDVGFFLKTGWYTVLASWTCTSPEEFVAFYRNIFTKVAKIMGANWRLVHVEPIDKLLTPRGRPLELSILHEIRENFNKILQIVRERLSKEFKVKTAGKEVDIAGFAFLTHATMEIDGTCLYIFGGLNDLEAELFINDLLTLSKELDLEIFVEIEVPWQELRSAQMTYEEEDGTMVVYLDWSDSSTTS